MEFFEPSASHPANFVNSIAEFVVLQGIKKVEVEAKPDVMAHDFQMDIQFLSTLPPAQQFTWACEPAASIG